MTKMQEFQKAAGLEAADPLQVNKFAEILTEALLVELEWLVVTREPASEYVETLAQKYKSWLQ